MSIDDVTRSLAEYKMKYSRGNLLNILYTSEECRAHIFTGNTWAGMHFTQALDKVSLFESDLNSEHFLMCDILTFIPHASIY